MVMYPNVGGFGAQDFLKLDDPELMLTCIRIYNDWQSEWASEDSRRLLPIASIPFWRCPRRPRKRAGARIWATEESSLPDEPQSFGQPLSGDPHWNPVWQVAVELGLPISFHIRSGDITDSVVKNRIASYGRAAAYTTIAIDLLLQNGCQVSDLIVSGVLARYPTIKFVSVESGIGWIPFVLEAMDYQFNGNNVREERPELDLLPSEYFTRNVYACCMGPSTMTGGLPARAIARLLNAQGRAGSNSEKPLILPRWNARPPARLSSQLGSPALRDELLSGPQVLIQDRSLALGCEYSLAQQKEVSPNPDFLAWHDS